MGKLSDVIGAVQKVHDVQIGYTVAVVDAGKVKVYMKNFGEFYNNQVETATTIILSRTDNIPQSSRASAWDASDAQSQTTRPSAKQQWFTESH